MSGKSKTSNAMSGNVNDGWKGWQKMSGKRICQPRMSDNRRMGNERSTVEA